MASLLERYRARRDWKRARTEARHVVRECRRILRRKGYRVPEATVKLLEERMAEVEAALGRAAAEEVREALARLDEEMDRHLAFARKSALREYAESIGIAVAIAFFLRGFVVEAFQIPSGSMIPTLEIGDHIFVSKFSYGIHLPFSDGMLVSFGMPRRGDVIVFKYPRDPSMDYIKRVVGLPGDEILVVDNQLFVNGEPVPREHVDASCSYAERAGGYRQACDEWIEHLDAGPHRSIFTAPGPTSAGPYKIPEGSVFVMGDNRDNSADSRVWGTVPLELIKGRALIVWWSRGPIESEGLSVRGLGEWFQAVRWGRFFTRVQ